MTDFSVVSPFPHTRCFPLFSSPIVSHPSACTVRSFECAIVPVFLSACEPSNRFLPAIDSSFPGSGLIREFDQLKVSVDFTQGLLQNAPISEHCEMKTQGIEECTRDSLNILFRDCSEIC